MKRIALLLMVLGMFTFAFGCQETVEDQRQDVIEAEREAVDDVREEERETEEVRREGAREIEQERQELRERQLEEPGGAAPVGRP